ncbi:DUF6035 family protein [Rhizobium leguminosarum]|uniref:DUF6035 family protein n=1 Tax=Rhizobium leguminosarum TaxID=384 RepID=UPI003F9453B8
MQGNVTFDPLAFAEPVLKPEIAEILDLENGEFLDVATFISRRRYDRLVAERVSIRENLADRPRFGCALCATPVYLVASREKRFFFRHCREDGSCPSITRSALGRDEIRALKYEGQRESLAHRTIKERVIRSLASDPSNSEILSEKQWRSTRDPASRRQPDVQALTVFGRVAFEAQLSTTFLDVVAGRRSFYRDEGALLVWVMAGFDPDYRRMTTDDLLFSNNSNILVIDEETTALSEGSGTFYLRSHYRVPELFAGVIRDRWESKIIAFRDLTTSFESQTAWAFDYAGQSEKLFAKEKEEVQRRDNDLRERICAFWMLRNQHTPDPLSHEETWRSLTRELSDCGVTPPTNDRYDRAVTGLMNGVLSAREKRPIGWDFKHLIEVAHRICDGYPEHALAMGFALRLYGCDELIAAQDKSGKWAKRARSIRDGIRQGDQRYLPDQDTLPFLTFAFPEVGANVERFLSSRLARSDL